MSKFNVFSLEVQTSLSPSATPQPHMLTAHWPGKLLPDGIFT